MYILKYDFCVHCLGTNSIGRNLTDFNYCTDKYVDNESEIYFKQVT